MPVTSVLLPNTNALSTGATADIGGVTMTQQNTTQINRIHDGSVGSDAVALTTDNTMVWVKNFFDDNQIPSGATINGIEVVAGPDSDGVGFGRFGTSAISSGTCKLKVHLHNGSAFSDALEPKIDVSSITGVSTADSGTSIVFDGTSKVYGTTDAVLYGGTSDLSGLSWSASDQAEWGLAFTFTEESNAGVIFGTRGLGLRCTYTDSFGKVVCGLSSAGIITGIGVPTSVINITSS